jgi:beta-xylosidase
MAKGSSLKPGAWGDLGNGYYRNPILKADFSDPDVIRVGTDFYLVCSDFHYMGMPVLHSRDLVNWSIIGQVYTRLDLDPRYDQMARYAHGSWAPALRYHDGRYYVYFCTPEEGLYMSSATDPAGPWTPLHEVCSVRGWEDPCPFWDDDGQAYLGHSTVGAGPIIIHRMSPDGKQLLDDGVIVYIGKIAEGTKIYKRNNFYYLVIPEGGVETGWQTTLRARNLYGPYERRVVLSQGQTEINGPHQGSLVELESGESWFIHFQSRGALGRVCHLQPVHWVDDWPVLGCAGEPVSVFRKPRVAQGEPHACLQTSDEFDGPELGLQWQWNHNPAPGYWSLTERPGYLRLKAMTARELMTARNTLTQKLIGGRGLITVEQRVENMAFGQRAGLAYLGGGGTEAENWIGVEQHDNSRRIVAVTSGVRYHGPELEGEQVWWQTQYDFTGATRFCFSLDGTDFIPLGVECRLTAGFWKGARIGLFTYNALEERGAADFHCFHYQHDGPALSYFT